MGLEEPVVDSLKNLKIDTSSVLDPKDPSFVVEPEYRPKTKHNEFVEALADQIPTIDLSPLQNKDEDSLKKLFDQIGKAAEDWGFFQVVNHGVPLDLIDRLQQEALDFFSLPLEEKNKVVRNLERPIGYYHQELTKNRRDWKEVFDYLVRDCVALPTSEGGEHRVMSQWPERPSGLRYDLLVIELFKLNFAC
jgi:isopenicillin N synthase-like dioxygenase